MGKIEDNWAQMQNVKHSWLWRDLGSWYGSECPCCGKVSNMTKCPKCHMMEKNFVGIQRIERYLIVMAVEVLVEWRDFEGTYDIRDWVKMDENWELEQLPIGEHFY